MKRLLVMRHAKSDWEVGGLADHDRPLNRRGTRSAAAMGRLLATIGEAPDHVISSTAVRARTTAELARDAGAWEADIETTGALYGTSPGGALAVMGRAPAAASSLMLVGHEPAWSGLVQRLTGGHAAMRTGSVAIIDLMLASWDNDGDVHGELVALLQPRHFTDDGD